VLFSVHCHNDLGLATANSLAGLAAGARRVECTVNGIGPRAGNTPLEEVVMLMRVRHARLALACGVDTTEIIRTSRLVAELTGTPVQANKAVVGANALAHGGALHLDTGLKEQLNYELMRPADVGLSDSKREVKQRAAVAEKGNGHTDERDMPNDENHVADTLRHMVFG
jgi:2-isopropylmalate synthase